MAMRMVKSVLNANPFAAVLLDVPVTYSTSLLAVLTTQELALLGVSYLTAFHEAVLCGGSLRCCNCRSPHSTTLSVGSSWQNR